MRDAVVYLYIELKKAIFSNYFVYNYNNNANNVSTFNLVL